MAEPTEYGACKNPRCPVKRMDVDLIHETGYCYICCPKYGKLGCEICWPDEDDDEDMY